MWRQITPPAAEPRQIRAGLGDLVLLWLLPVLPLNNLHLILETEFQLLEPHFFQFFVFGEVAFFGE
jgi:hypothetical protein